jgi:hypothetical protein
MSCPLSPPRTKNYSGCDKTDFHYKMDTWVKYIHEWLNIAVKDPLQHRDIGKVLAYAAEKRAQELMQEKTGRPFRVVVGQPYDLINDDNLSLCRAQIKFRMKDWHFETTRRNSEKNKNANSTGHVAYKKDEFDYVVIFKPGDNFDFDTSTIRIIPTKEIINPKNTEYLVTNLNVKKIRGTYDSDEKTNEIMKKISLGLTD